MPTLGITDDDCLGDGSYEGHEDLLFKKMQFQTVIPLEKIRSVAVHTLISGKLRESSANLRHKESRCQSRYIDDIWKSNPTASVEAPQPPHVKEAEAAEEMANYYIRNAFAHSRQVHDGGPINQPSGSVPRLGFTSLPSTLCPSQPPMQPNSQASETGLPAPSVRKDAVTAQGLLRNGNVPTGGPSIISSTPMSRDVSLLTSSSANEKSFSFLDSPVAAASVNEAISKMNHLDTYNGSRPSFGLGTLTSTPFAFVKKAGAQFPSSGSEKSNIDPSDHAVISQKLQDAEEPVKSKESIECRGQKHDAAGASRSFEEFYLAEMKLAEEYDKAKKRVEENKEQKALRALTKRTIVEKVTVGSKKTASMQEIASVSGFLCMLLNGKEVLGYGDKKLQLPEGDFTCYGFIITIESYMGVVERDPSLALVISRILTLICGNVQNFEAVLLGKILRTSQLISLNEEKCKAYAKHLTEIEDRRFALIPETSYIKLFIHLHIIGSASQRMNHFTIKNLWRYVKFVTDESSRTMATAAILLGLIENGSNHLKMVDPKKWSLVLDKISNTLIPRLEAEVEEDTLRRDIGEDTIVSSLRHAVLRRRSSG
ncbi:hypothetical protein GCK32_003231 [Trichostrongylus colubriformis]|uniref:Nucleoporin GLE1 n=1 Tax=Trichostrongylus colubriformis TaxID=6319 RepID=A0AAN8EYH5_TRICO